MAGSNALTRALPTALKEIRLHFCQTGQQSQGTRQFVASNYSKLKQSNPDLPILIRESSGTHARVFARFERGVEKSLELDNLSEQDVQKKFTELISSSA